LYEFKSIGWKYAFKSIFRFRIFWLSIFQNIKTFFNSIVSGDIKYLYLHKKYEDRLYYRLFICNGKMDNWLSEQELKKMTENGTNYHNVNIFCKKHFEFVDFWIYKHEIDTVCHIFSNRYRE
jgi:hypothetical protein